MTHFESKATMTHFESKATSDTKPRMIFPKYDLERSSLRYLKGRRAVDCVGSRPCRSQGSLRV
eukprot:72944-Amorphochlora_amoeboformis.AAC.1